MKKIKTFLGVWSIFLVLVMILPSCKKENSSPDNMITKEIAKIETMYKEGDVKVETFLMPGESKTETIASDEIVLNILKTLERPNTEFSKRTLGTRVGVIKEIDQSCGIYDLLEITMDCEDSGNATTYHYWKGDNYVNGNVILRFCLVPTSVFQSSKYYKYAVLDLYGGDDHRIVRVFDNEDGSNINSVKLNGTILSASQISAQLGGGIIQNGNTQLTFYVYEQDPQNGAETFPDLGMPYGVIGYFNDSFAKGWIHTDDEDTRNINREWYWTHIIPNSDPAWNVFVQDLITGGGNTDIYMTRVRE